MHRFILSKRKEKTGRITVAGGGLAGCEAAFQAAKAGMKVDLYEMRPAVKTPVHKTSMLAELVCSNSLGSGGLTAASGLLKEELRKLGSLVVEAADYSKVPAGQALAVDRNLFSQYIENKINELENINIIREEVLEIPRNADAVIIATGPLTSDAFAKKLLDFAGNEFLFFYDAVSPIIDAESIDFSKVFAASRYGKGTDDYINCPMTKEEYDRFYQALISAERVNPHDFESNCFFEGCMPIEEIADRGRETLLFGPLKPVGLDSSAAAVVQLRKENKEGTLYNLVGFQTRLKWSCQKEVIRLIPGLEKADIVRYGVMHRNIYIDSPRLLLPSLQFKKNPDIFAAGQITGVEGYVESAASGLLAGINASLIISGSSPFSLPEETVLASLINYITDPNRKKFQPMNANFGIMPPLPHKRGRGKAERKQAKSLRSLEVLEQWLNSHKVNKSSMSNKSNNEVS